MDIGEACDDFYQKAPEDCPPGGFLTRIQDRWPPSSISAETKVDNKKRIYLFNLLTFLFVCRTELTIIC